MKDTNKMFFVLGIVCLLASAVFININNDKTQKPIAQNYAGLYALHLIPNAVNVPPTKADVVIAVSDEGSRALIDSPFGYVYERSVN